MRGVTAFATQLPLTVRLRSDDRQIRVVSTDPDFDHFFLSHYDGLVRSLTAITGDHTRADDCVQEAFVRAYGRWRRIRRYDNPATWVRRVAINLSRDGHRSEARRRRREDRNGVELPDNAPSPEMAVAGDLDLVALLGRLTPQQRTVAALFYIEDISVAEVAAILDLSTGAVKFHLNKARSALKIILEAEEVGHV